MPSACGLRYPSRWWRLQLAEPFGSSQKHEQHHFLPGPTPAVAFRLRVTLVSMAFISGLATVTTWHPSGFPGLYSIPGTVANSTDSHSALLSPLPWASMPLAKSYPSYEAVKCHLSCEATPPLSQPVSLANSLALLQLQQQVACLSHCLWVGVPNWHPRLNEESQPINCITITPNPSRHSSVYYRVWVFVTAPNENFSKLDICWLMVCCRDNATYHRKFYVH